MKKIIIILLFIEKRIIKKMDKYIMNKKKYKKLEINI